MNKRLYFLSAVFLILLSACSLSAPNDNENAEDDAVSFETAIALTVAAELEAGDEDTGSTDSEDGDTAESGADPTDTALPADTAVPTETSVSPTDTPVPSDTPTPTETEDPGECNLAGYIEDVTVDDDTVFSPGETFVKKWRLINNGTCVWTVDYDLIFDSGEQMAGPASKEVSDVAVDPGDTVVVEVQLTAPGSAGTYRGNWKLRSGTGESFGLRGGIAFWVQIQVSAPAAPAPTDTPEPQADLIVNVFELTPATPIKGNLVQVKVQVYNQGNKAAGAFKLEWYAGENYPSPACEWDVPSLAAHGGRVFTCTYPGYPSHYGAIVTVAIADRAGVIPESDETNNSAEMTIAVNP